LKKTIFITLIVLNVTLFGFSTYMYFSGKRYEKDKNTQNVNQKTDSSTSTLINKYQDINIPEYVPPKDGGDNSFWCGNRHRYLLKDRKCYFGNGLQRRYRGDRN
jgi:hypothetical protein